MATALKYESVGAIPRSETFGAFETMGLGSVTVQAVQDERVATGDSIEVCRDRLITAALGATPAS